MDTTGFIEEVLFSRAPRGFGGRFFGAYPATVRDLRDPEGQGRVSVALPWSPDGNGGVYETWARLATLMGGNNRGSWFIPDVGDEVLIVFLAGDPRHPVVIGGLWNGQDAPPERMDAGGENNIKKIRSRNGVQITIDDTDGHESLVLETPGGQRLTLRDGPGAIELADANGNTVTLDSSGISVNAAARVQVQSGANTEVTAAMVTVNAGMSRFNGVIQPDTVLTNSTVSASYTPGAGNIW